MTIDERMVGSAVVLDLHGKLMLGDGDGLLKDKIQSLMFQGQRQMVLNLSDLTYMDSSGLGELIASYASVVKQSGSLKISGLGKRLSDLLTIAKVLTVFDVYESEAEALQSFSTA